jgi:predicted DNA-binding transcriptional regulator YafY
MARPTARVLTLLELLQSGGIRTVAELADRLGVDERTVRRYVDHLIDLEVPVESVRGRYGGYRLAPGYRLPPLMLTDDEALAVLLGLVAGRRAGLLTTADTASETAAAKIRRVLPERLGRRLDALLGSLAFTAPQGETHGETAVPETGVLLALADAVRHRQPVWIRYTAGDGRPSERTLHPYGLVAHAGRWYVTGVDPGIGEERNFRLDRIADVRARPGSFEPPDGFDPAQHVLLGLATAPYQHQVTLRIQATVEQIRARLPASVAIIEELTPADGADSGAGPWFRVELRAQRLDWVPAVLASLDRPFLVERPDELRDLIAALAGRLLAAARKKPSDAPVTVRPLSRDDFPLVQRWLAMPHVQAWWGSEPMAPADVERKYGPRADGTDPTRVFVIELADQPIGIIQCYRHEDYADWDRAVGIPASAGIDYLIGEPAQCGRGFGTAAIGCLVPCVFALYPEIAAIVAVPQAANHASRRALEKAGFTLIGERTLDSDDPSDVGPSAVYALTRPPVAGTISR